MPGLVFEIVQGIASCPLLYGRPAYLKLPHHLPNPGLLLPAECRYTISGVDTSVIFFFFPPSLPPSVVVVVGLFHFYFPCNFSHRAAIFIFSYNGSLPAGDKGRKRSKYTVYQRPVPNGVQPTNQYRVQAPQAPQTHQVMMIDFCC